MYAKQFIKARFIFLPYWYKRRVRSTDINMAKNNYMCACEMKACTQVYLYMYIYKMRSNCSVAYQHLNVAAAEKLLIKLNYNCACGYNIVFYRIDRERIAYARTMLYAQYICVRNAHTKQMTDCTLFLFYNMVASNKGLSDMCTRAVNRSGLIWIYIHFQCATAVFLN